MAKVYVDEQVFTDIANQTRRLKNSQDTYTPSEMATELSTVVIGDYNAKMITEISGTSLGSLTALIQKVPVFNTTNITSMNSAFSSCNNLIEIPLLDTGNVTDMTGMFMGCVNLVTVPLLNTNKVTNMSNMFFSCRNLSDETLNNILAMCTNATNYTGTKTLYSLGLRSQYYPNNKIQSLSNYQSFIAANWTTGF